MKKKKKSNFSLAKTVIFAAFITFFGYTLITQQFSISEKKAELKAVNAQIEQAKSEKELIDEQLKTVNTPEYIERVARTELGYAAPDEIVFMDAGSKK